MFQVQVSTVNTGHTPQLELDDRPTVGFNGVIRLFGKFVYTDQPEHYNH